MPRPLLSALAEGMDVALAKPKATAAVGVVGLAGAVIAALASPVAGAIVVAVLFVGLLALFVFALRQRAIFEGPYRVLEDETIWDLAEPDGTKAVATKRQRVRFNYPVIALTEHAWGDGDQFAAYDCEHGRLVDTGSDGSRQYAIIALAAEKQRGEEARLVSHRTVRNGFCGSEEWVEYAVDKISHRSTLVIRFPPGRPPRALSYRRKSDGRTMPANDSVLMTEGDRTIFRLTEKAPRVGEQYTVRWDW